ncbi:hypothetical protein [Parafrankia sp. FMc2]|uniref:hypothetical protein n=1 Tax=Parafrankia sp. FMc2 TaxID=3233196 RepID=UPI0034D696B7
MGFWGTYVVGRASRPLTELPALRPSAAKASWHWHGKGGWQVVQIEHGPDGWNSPDLPRAWDGLLQGLTRQSGHPVLAAVIKHSEGAQLLGHSSRTGRWGGWIMAENITWRLLPEDGPRQHWDENGIRHTESTADYRRRERLALDHLYATAGPPGARSAPSAVAWATEAGLIPDPAAVAAALDTAADFAEEALFTFLTALGLPDAPDLQF